MWMTLASGLQVAASAVDDAPEVTVEDSVDPTGIPGLDKQLPTREQLLEMLDSMTGLSEEEKNSIRDDLLESLRVESSGPLVGNDLTMQTIVLLSLLGLVALIFGKYPPGGRSRARRRRLG